MSGTIHVDHHTPLVPSKDVQKAHHWMKENFRQLPKESLEALAKKCADGGLTGHHLENGPLATLALGEEIIPFFKKYGVDIPEDISSHPLEILCQGVTPNENTGSSRILLSIWKMCQLDIAKNHRTPLIIPQDTSEDEDALGV